MAVGFCELARLLNETFRFMLEYSLLKVNFIFYTIKGYNVCESMMIGFGFSSHVLCLAILNKLITFYSFY